MKLVYIISQGHSGSTLTDCILGTHPDFVSSGELCYLNWQLYRTLNTSGSIQEQNVCTCGKDFRACSFWSKVFIRIKEQTGKDIVNHPESFDTAFFGMFSFQERGGFERKFMDKVKSYSIREWLERGNSLSSISWLEPKITGWLKNNWLLYTAMAETANKKVVVDSSKDLRIALLLKEYKPKDVYVLFIHRDVKGLAASSKKLSENHGKTFSLDKIVREKVKFEKTVARVKKIKGINYMDFNYEDIVSQPASFLEEVVKLVEVNPIYTKQAGAFFIDPSIQHLVAGNPMRYKGKKEVVFDNSWEKKLNSQELEQINTLMSHIK